MGTLHHALCVCDIVWLQISMSVKWKMDYVIKSVLTVMVASSVLVPMVTGWLVVSVKVKINSNEIKKIM